MPKKLPKFEEYEWGRSKESASLVLPDSDSIYLNLEVVAGKIKVQLGEISFPLEDLQKVVSFLQKKPLELLSSIETYDIRDRRGSGISSQMITDAFDKVFTPEKMKNLFDRDAVFYERLAKDKK